MPGMDGLQLLSEIKQRYPALPVMVVTAYGEEERRRLLNERLYQLSTAMTGTTLLDRMTANPPPPIDRSGGGEGQVRGMKTSSRRQG